MHTFTDFWRKSDLTLPIVPYQRLDLCLPLDSKGTPFPRLEAWQEINFSSPHPQLCKDYWWPPTPAHSTIPITLVCAATFCALFSASFQLPPSLHLFMLSCWVWPNWQTNYRSFLPYFSRRGNCSSWRVFPHIHDYEQYLKNVILLNEKILRTNILSTLTSQFSSCPDQYCPMWLPNYGFLQLSDKKFMTLIQLPRDGNHPPNHHHNQHPSFQHAFSINRLSKDLPLFLVCILHKTEIQITDNRVRPNSSWEERKQCTLPMRGNGSPQDRGHTPSAEYCHFKYILTISRSEQAEVHKPKELNFDHFINFEIQMGI